MSAGIQRVQRHAAGGVLPFAAAFLLVMAPGFGGPPAVMGQDAGDGAEEPLRPGDVVELASWDEEEIDGEYPVDEDGTVILPYLGPIEVADRSPTEIRREILEGYEESFRGDARVHVSLLRRVRLFGEVGSPGLYHVDRSMDLGDLIAEAGGVTGEGDESRIQIARGGGTVLDVGLDSETAVTEALQSGDQITVDRRRWYRRHFPLFFGIASSVMALAARDLIRAAW